MKGTGTLSDLERLKAIHGPKAKEEYKRKTRRVTLKCWNLDSDPKMCPHLRVEWSGGFFRVKQWTCRIKRCPRDDVQEEGG